MRWSTKKTFKGIIKTENFWITRIHIMFCVLFKPNCNLHLIEKCEGNLICFPLSSNNHLYFLNLKATLISQIVFYRVLAKRNYFRGFLILFINGVYEAVAILFSSSSIKRKICRMVWPGNGPIKRMFSHANQIAMTATDNKIYPHLSFL